MDIAVETGFILHFVCAGQLLSGYLVHVCANALLEMLGRQDADVVQILHQHCGAHLVALLVFVMIHYRLVDLLHF